MVKQITHKQLNQLIKVYYDKKNIDGRKNALMIYGTFGVGKSAVVRETSKEIALKDNREFCEWNKMTDIERENVFQNPEKYFCMIDIRLSEFDSSDIKGLPDYHDNESIIWKVSRWAKFLELPNSNGVLFFDEINLAPPLVISSTYKIIYDRVINESKINDNWLILGCGNKDEDRAFTHELASPVRDRGGEVELICPSADSWTNWALENEIDSRIIGFVNFKPSVLHSVNFEDNQKFTTERGWARVNSLINGVENYDDLDLVCSSAISEGIAREFSAFCKIKEQINLEEIIKTPSKLESVKEIDMKYFIVTALSERYKAKKIDFKNIMAISEELDRQKSAEFVALFWRLCMRINPKKFKDEIINSKSQIITKYTKYI